MNDVRGLVDDFVGNLEDVIRRAIVEEITQKMQEAGSITGQSRGSQSRLQGNKSSGGQTSSRRGPGRPKGSGNKAKKSNGRTRRSAGQLGKLNERVVDFLQDNPGSSMEQMKQALDVSTPQLRLPLNKLREQKAVKTEGEKRAMKYSLAPGVTPEQAKQGSARKRRGRKGGGAKKAA